MAKRKEKLACSNRSLLSQKKGRESGIPEDKFSVRLIVTTGTGSKVTECLSSGATVRVERRVGDYQIGDRILVERKTTRDFVDTGRTRSPGGIRHGSMLHKTGSYHRGGDLYAQRDIHPNAIRGALAAISINFGVSVFQTAGPQETAELLMVLARRESDDGNYERGPAGKGSYEGNARTLEAILSAFPEIGLKHARSLLSAFGSLQAIMNAEKEDLLTVSGIGEKKGITDIRTLGSCISERWSYASLQFYRFHEFDHLPASFSTLACPRDDGSANSSSRRFPSE